LGVVGVVLGVTTRQRTGRSGVRIRSMEKYFLFNKTAIPTLEHAQSTTQ